MEKEWYSTIINGSSAQVKNFLNKLHQAGVMSADIKVDGKIIYYLHSTDLA